MEDRAQEIINSILSPQHPAMDRIQKALKTQLVEAKQAVDEDYREKVEALRKANEEHELIGVELYGFQQQLGNLQAKLDTHQQTLNTTTKERQQSQTDLEATSAIHSQTKIDLSHRKGKLEEARKENSHLRSTLRQINEHNERLESDIAMTRREAYKVESDVTDQEKGKQFQDFLIDSLNDQMRTLESTLVSLDSQIHGQQANSAQVEEAIREVLEQMHLLSKEKRTLLGQWQSSLVGIRKRDAALQEADKEIQQGKQQIQTLETTVSGFKRLFREVREEHEHLETTAHRAQNELTQTERVISELEKRHQDAEKTFEDIKVSITKSEDEHKGLSVEKAAMETDISAIERDLRELTKRIRECNNAIQQAEGAQTTLQKEAVSNKKDRSKTAASIIEQEQIAAQVENTLAQMRVDSLEVESHIEALEEALERVVEELTSKDDLVQNYETELRKRNGIIEKKQRQVDLLNRKYESIRAKQHGPEELGPYEATIKNLQKEIETFDNECARLQQLWLRDQTEFVNMEDSITKENDDIRKCRSDLSIVQERNRKLMATINSERAEEHMFNKSIDNFYKDMTKLDRMVADASSKQGELSSSNYSTEKNFQILIEQKQQTATQIQQEIDTLRIEKETLFGEMVEYERQIMVWEKKIQLEKETQALVDPSVGNSEIQSMRKEIHRMKLRQNQLQKRQESLLLELERRITKREDIRTRGRGNQTRTKATKNGANSLTTLQKQVKQLMRDTNACAQTVKSYRSEQDTLSEQVDQLTSTNSQMKIQVMELQRTLEQDEYLRRKNFSVITRLQVSILAPHVNL